MMGLVACALVMVGGAIGGIARFAVSTLVGRQLGEAFPWGTFIVNVSGALLIGVLAGLARKAGGLFAEDLFRDFVVVGICGGYTTVSSFALQSVTLALEDERASAIFYVALSAAACVGAVACGFALAGLA
jgi:CrcB protein